MACGLALRISYSAAKTIAASVDYGVRQICATLGEVCDLQNPAVQKKP